MTIFIWIHFKCTFFKWSTANPSLWSTVLCTVCISAVVIWWISSESFSTFVLSSTTLRPSADTQSTARTAFLPACVDTHNTHSERWTGRETHKKSVDFPISSPRWGPSPSSTFTQMHFHLSTTPENREKLKTLSFEKVTAVLGEGCMSYNARERESKKETEEVKHSNKHTFWFGELRVFTLT